MIPPPLPSNERQRLATLRSLKILDTAPEERFDRITRLARRLFDVPIALVTLVDAERQWFKSRQGLDTVETPRSISFCGHSILNEHLMVVKDALQDERFRDNPLVTGEPGIRFYAGYPLSGPDGSKLGSLCIIDRKPRELPSEDLRTLSTLGQVIESELAALNLTTTDRLTGLSNLRGFLEIGRHAVALSKRFGYTLQLLLLRLEGMEEIQQRSGVAEYERALVEVGRLLIASFRESDLVGRIGDCEFGILLSRDSILPGNPGLERLERLLNDLNSHRPQDSQLRARVASQAFVSARHTSMESLIAEAEQRLV